MFPLLTLGAGLPSYLQFLLYNILRIFSFISNFGYFALFEKDNKKRGLVTGSVTVEMMLELHWSDVISGSITDVFKKATALHCVLHLLRLDMKYLKLYIS